MPLRYRPAKLSGTGFHGRPQAVLRYCLRPNRETCDAWYDPQTVPERQPGKYY